MSKDADYEEIRKKAISLREECSRCKIPMMVTFAREDAKGTVYESEIVTPTQLGIQLSDDRFSKLNVAFTKGFYIRFKDNILDDVGAGDAFGQMMDMMEDEDSDGTEP